MVRRIKHKDNPDRWVVMGPDTAMFSEEPPPPKGKRSSYN